MLIKKLIVPLSMLLFLCGCGGDDNKLELDETLYEEGAQVVKLYASAHQNTGDGEAEKKAADAAEEFLESYESGSYESEEEEEFVGGIRLLKERFLLFGMQRVLEEMGGDLEGESEETKEGVKELLLYFKDRFGIELE